MSKLQRRSRSWATSLCFCLILQACPAHGQDTQPLEHQGKTGIWFPMDKAKKLLGDVAQLPGIKSQLELTAKRLELEKTRNKLLDRNAKTAEQIAAVWKSTAESQSKLLAQGQPWWRHPYLWTAVGLIIGTSVTVAVVYAVEARGAH